MFYACKRHCTCCTHSTEACAHFQLAKSPCTPRQPSLEAESAAHTDCLSPSSLTYLKPVAVCLAGKLKHISGGWVVHHLIVGSPQLAQHPPRVELGRAQLMERYCRLLCSTRQHMNSVHTGSLHGLCQPCLTGAMFFLVQFVSLLLGLCNVQMLLHCIELCQDNAFVACEGMRERDERGTFCPAIAPQQLFCAVVRVCFDGLQSFGAEMDEPCLTMFHNGVSG